MVERVKSIANRKMRVRTASGVRQKVYGVTTGAFKRGVAK